MNPPATATGETIPHTMANRVDASLLIDAVIRGDEASIQALLSPLRLPAGELLTGAQFMMEGIDVDQRMVGVQLLASYMRSHGDVRLAAALALGAVRGCERLGFLEGSQPSARMLMVANLIDQCANCFTESGHVEEMLSDAARWAAWLDGRELMVQWQALHRAWVEGCFHSGLYEKADELLKTLLHRFPENRESPITRRLLDKLDDLLRAVDRPDTPSVGLDWVLKQSLKEVTGLEGIIGPELEATGADSEAAKLALMGLLGLTPPPTDAPGITEAVAALPEAANPLHQTNFLLEQFSKSLQSGQLPLSTVADLAGQTAGHALEYGFWEEACTSGWLRSVALRRAGRIPEAADELARLRAKIHERQLGIGNPLLRAALAEYLPHLWVVSAQVLYGLGRSEELFEVIEDSKGRILSALTYEREAGPDEPSAMVRLTRILAQSPARACYLTCLADQDETYAVMVGPEGELQAKSLAFGRKHLAAAAQELFFSIDGQPSSLTRSAGIDPDHPFEVDYGPILKVLGPLADWLAALFKDGTLKDDDVLCVSPDGPMYNLPLGVLGVAGRPLLERVALVVAPCVDVLDSCARKRSGHASHPQGHALVVPRSTEFDNAQYDADLFRSDALELARLRSTAIPPAEQSDAVWLLSHDLTGGIVHLGCHGWFDTQAPLEKSGLMLAFDGALPVGRDARGIIGLLTPNEATRLQARGAQFVLRACVSGRTTEVTSREALGMIWSLFQAGASNVTAAGWHADVRSAAPLLAEYYRAWSDHESPALALRSAARQMRSVGGNWSHPYHYAVFTTYGYWA